MDKFPIEELELFCLLCEVHLADTCLTLLGNLQSLARGKIIAEWLLREAGSTSRDVPGL